MQIFQDNEDLRRVPVLLAGANCTGNEASLADCPGNGLNVDTVQCGLQQIVTLICYSDLDQGVHPKLTINVCRLRNRMRKARGKVSNPPRRTYFSIPANISDRALHRCERWNHDQLMHPSVCVPSMFVVSCTCVVYSVHEE